MDNQILSDRHCCELIINDLLVSVALCFIYLFYIYIQNWPRGKKNLIGTMGGKVWGFLCGLAV